MKGFRCGLVVAAIAVIGLAGVVQAELAGTAAPDFVLKGVNGKNYRLSEYRGQVVLLSFWASWCGECRSQLESLAEMHQRFAGSGLEMLAVSLDRDMHQVDDAARAIGIDFPALHDAGGVIGKQYDVDKMPYIIVIDQDGIVRDEFVGFTKGEEEQYLATVRELLSY